MSSFIEKNHNEHLDILQNYKNHLVEQVKELEKMDRYSEFVRKWNEATITERKAEIKILDKILKNLIRF